MAWRQFVMDLHKLDLDTVENVLLRNGAQAISLSDGGDDPILEPEPGEVKLWQDARITGLFPVNLDAAELERDLMSELQLGQLPNHEFTEVADREWEREWLKDFHAMRFGTRLWVCPSHASVTEPDAIVVKLDPGLAFGTGTHTTTALCLEWLDTNSPVGQRVLDFGCGSGILAIAALLLNAATADAYDIDAQAIEATNNNAGNNGIAKHLHAFDQQNLIGADYDLVLANILARPLCELAEPISSRLIRGGMLILSGILDYQADDVMAAYAEWVEFAPPTRRDGWVRLDGVRRSGQPGGEH